MFSRGKDGGWAIRCSSRRRWWRRTARARRPRPGRRIGISVWSPPMAETGRKKQPAGLRARAEEISAILKLLGNPQRLLIACLLCEGEYAVSEIEEKLGIRQPTLSQQLGALREAGVIEGRRAAKAVIYHLADEQTRHLLDALHRIFCPERLAAPAAQTSPRPRVASSAGAGPLARVATEA